MNNSNILIENCLLLAIQNRQEQQLTNSSIRLDNHVTQLLRRMESNHHWACLTWVIRISIIFWARDLTYLNCQSPPPSKSMASTTPTPPINAARPSSETLWSPPSPQASPLTLCQLHREVPLNSKTKSNSQEESRYSWRARGTWR